jgi:hypothetical protein
MKAMQAQQPPQYDQSGSFQMGGPGLWSSWFQQQPQGGESQPLPPTQGGQLGMAQPPAPPPSPSAPPPRPQRPSMQELIARQPPAQNPWAGQRQVQQGGNMPPPQRPQFARTQIPAWMQARPSAQPQVPPNQVQGRQQMMAQMLRRGARNG